MDVPSTEVRWIDLEGAHNVRDLGALPAGSGVTRHGVLLRSDALDELTAEDVRRLVDELDLAHVVDLRSGSERLERGRGRLGASGVRYTEPEVIGPADLARRAEVRAAAVAAGHPPTQILSEGYIELLDIGAGAFVEAFERIVEPGGAPALVHCAIGKDRTGVLVALLLDAAGVDRAAIATDYGRSGERMEPIIARWLSPERAPQRRRAMTEQLAAFTATSAPETMDLVLAHLDQRWGGGAEFLVHHGASPRRIEDWRRLLVDPG